jgi:hypothetical protein
MNTTKTAAPVSATKTEICSLLRAFINQRPGLDFDNHGDVSAYRSKLRGITRDRREALYILQAVEWRDGITADDIRAAFPRAFMGRLELKEDGAKPALSYCAGQYFPTEYRAAAAAVLASVLWAYMRECMPKPTGGDGVNTSHTYENGLSAGEWLRRHFRREFGRGIQSRWFN